MTAPPGATITSPPDGGAYDLDQTVTSAFSCSQGSGGAPVTSCTDSNGASAGAGSLDTSAYGEHTYTVTATNQDGLTGTASISYWVADPPTATLISPDAGGTYEEGAVVPTSFSCTDGQGGPGISSCADSNGGSGTGGGSTPRRPGLTPTR